ncbi:hypothetical protein PybrP1_011944 [[Pythium] brassicae (nom. inval.)]|nr:hypothetical protein PybrP1_011944 [[Pythium] brassicae (nom. inval.)]
MLAQEVVAKVAVAEAVVAEEVAKAVVVVVAEAMSKVMAEAEAVAEVLAEGASDDDGEQRIPPPEAIASRKARAPKLLAPAPTGTIEPPKAKWGDASGDEDAVAAAAKTAQDGAAQQLQRQTKPKKPRLTKAEKLERSRFGASAAVAEQTQRTEKRRHKKAKRLATEQQRAERRAGVDGEDHVDDDVAFDSDAVASASESGDSSSGAAAALGFVLVDLETDGDELALLADAASSSGIRVGAKLLRRIAKVEAQQRSAGASKQERARDQPSDVSERPKKTKKKTKATAAKPVDAARHETGKLGASTVNDADAEEKAPVGAAAAKAETKLKSGKQNAVSAAVNKDMNGGRGAVASTAILPTQSPPPTAVVTPLSAPTVSIVGVKAGGKKARKRLTKLVAATASRTVESAAAETTLLTTTLEAAAPVDGYDGPTAVVHEKAEVATAPPSGAAHHASNIVAPASLAGVSKPVSKRTAARARKEAERVQKFAERAEHRKERGRRAKHADAAAVELTRGDDSTRTRATGESKKTSKKKNGGSHPSVYEEYVERDVVLRGLESGAFFQGRLRVNAKFRTDAYVPVDGIPVDVLVKGLEDRNRAFDGDVVAIQLRPESEWQPLKASDDKKAAAVAAAVSSPSTPIDASKLHALWLPSVDASTCFVDRPSATADARDAAGATNSEGGQRAAAVSATIAARNLRPTAKVVLVLAQGNTQGFIGSLEPKTKPTDADAPLASDDAFAFFNAHDERLPRRIQIPRLQLPDEFVHRPLAYARSMLCFCRIKSWGTQSARPIGDFVKTLGEFTGIESGIAALLTQHGLLPHADDFRREILDDLDATFGASGEKWTIPADELAKRRDFRDVQVFSIDPYNARDLDDALHIRALDAERTTFEVGVHIADVTHFVESGSLLDAEAQQRATSVYLVNRVLPMLPRVLCEKLCSLQPQVDRLAFSVVWQMRADGSLVDACAPWFGKSVIRSCCKLDYGSAQRMLDGEITHDALALWEPARRPVVGANPQISPASVIESVKDLWRVAQRRRATRFETGAISLNNVKLVFALDAAGNPSSFGSYELKDSNRLVEEYMLLANFLVAQQLLHAHGPLAFVRSHPPPAAPAMEAAVTQLAAHDVAVDASSTHALAASLERVRAEHGDVAFVVAQALVTKPMHPAEYLVAGTGASPDAWRHYALNIPYYTHFTSPIRRYADVVVHRLLQASLAGDSNGDSDSASAPTLPALAAVAQNCNEKKMAAKHTESACDLVFLCAHVKHHGAVPVTGVIMSVSPQSFTVYVLELGLEERMALKTAGLAGAWNERAATLSIRVKKAGGEREKTKPIELSFLKKLRLEMAATTTMPLKLTFAVLGE